MHRMPHLTLSLEGPGRSYVGAGGAIPFVFLTVSWSSPEIMSSPETICIKQLLTLPLPRDDGCWGSSTSNSTDESTSSTNSAAAARPPRGPAIDYFTTATPPRPIIQTDAVSQRSLIVAQEAHLKRQSALRLEREWHECEQREAQQKLPNVRKTSSIMSLLNDEPRDPRPTQSSYPQPTLYSMDQHTSPMGKLGVILLPASIIVDTIPLHCTRSSKYIQSIHIHHTNR